MYFCPIANLQLSQTVLTANESPSPWPLWVILCATYHQHNVLGMARNMCEGSVLCTPCPTSLCQLSQPMQLRHSYKIISPEAHQKKKKKKEFWPISAHCITSICTKEKQGNNRLEAWKMQGRRGISMNFWKINDLLECWSTTWLQFLFSS